MSLGVWICSSRATDPTHVELGSASFTKPLSEARFENMNTCSMASVTHRIYRLFFTEPAEVQLKVGVEVYGPTSLTVVQLFSTEYAKSLVKNSSHTSNHEILSINLTIATIFTLHNWVPFGDREKPKCRVRASRLFDSFLGGSGLRRRVVHGLLLGIAAQRGLDLVDAVHCCGSNGGANNDLDLAEARGLGGEVGHGVDGLGHDLPFGRWGLTIGAVIFATICLSN